MAAPETDEPRADLERDDHVAAAVDMTGVPAGTRGRVKLVNGFTWIRYWVMFDNGVDKGSIDRAQLNKTDKSGRVLDAA